MLRTGVLCCAMAGVLGLAVGCSDVDAKIKSRDEAATTMKTTLDDLDKKVEELKQKADKATGDEKAKLEAKWKESATKRDAAKKKLEELKAAAADKWEAVKKDAEAVFNEAKKTVEQ